jgi:uncharacterized protein YbbC (DUF1343 family)
MLAGNERVFRRTKGPRWKFPSFVKLLLIAGIMSVAAIIFLGYQKYDLWIGAKSTRSTEVSNKKSAPTVRLGIENLNSSLDLFKGKRVGLITNATGVDSKMRRTVDILHEKLKLVTLFAPEHGLRGNVVAGATVPYEIDARTGLPIYSLHGDTRKPTAAMLKNIDILAFDIQDIGARSYTYIYTMAYAMQSAREHNKTFVVFDRPNPVGGIKVEGGLLKNDYSSFIGLYPIPIRHGLTVGELARLFNEEFGIGARLVVIPMQGWSRRMQQSDTGLPWVMTSPNIPTIDSALAYTGTGLFGGSNVSEGIGTTRPFELVGAPWLDGEKMAEKMNALRLVGVYFRPVHFTPQWGKYQGRVCSGVQLHITDRHEFSSVTVGLRLLEVIRELGGNRFKWNEPKGNERWMIDLYAGGPELRVGKIATQDLLMKWAQEAEAFRLRSAKYHLYK